MAAGIKLPYRGLVTWLDAFSDPAHQVWDLSALEHAPLVMETLGWIARDDEVGVTMFSERISNSDGTYSWRGRGFVPRGMVVKVESLTPLKKRPPKDVSVIPAPEHESHRI